SEVVIGRSQPYLGSDSNVGEGVVTIFLPLLLVAACVMYDVVCLGSIDGNGAC
ncbi:hypothetical protein Tco_1453615, partial [Tanacetum coccineum]